MIHNYQLCYSPVNNSSKTKKGGKSMHAQQSMNKL